MKFLLSIGQSIVAMGLLSGCASIVDGTNQSLSVKTVSSAGDVSGAQCQLMNSKGSWFVTTPGSVTVHRAYGALKLSCKKDGYQPAVQTAQSTTKSMAFGNALFGGVVGVGVDMSTGAAYDYPELITVQMKPVALSSAQPSLATTVPIN